MKTVTACTPEVERALMASKEGLAGSLQACQSRGFGTATVDLSKSLRLESGILVVVDMVGSAEVLTPRIGAEAPLRRRVCARIDDRRLVDSHRPVPTGGLNVRFAMRGGCDAVMWPKRAGLLWDSTATNRRRDATAVHHVPSLFN